MARGVGAGVGKPPVNEPAGWDVVRGGLWGFDGRDHCEWVPAEGQAGTLIALFAAGMAILAACTLVDAVVWPQRLAELGILSERSGDR